MINGVATFNITYQSAGSETVDAAFATPNVLNPTSWTTVVSAATATQLVLTPASSVVVAPANETFTLTAEDQFGNTDTTYASDVTITSSGVPATLPGSVTMANGTATFTGTFNTK